jgi:hypothetical protein
MRLDKAAILDQLATVITFAKRFRFILAFTIFSLMYAYIMTQVNAISQQQPSEVRIAEKATAAPRTRVDEDLVKQITALEEQNVQVKTIFNEARKNPFSE